MLRLLIIAVFCFAYAQADMSALAASRGASFSPAFLGLFHTRLAQQGGNGGARARMLAPPSAASGSHWQAAKAARACASGGTILRVDPNGSGYDVRVLVASQVVVVRVDGNGNCR